MILLREMREKAQMSQYQLASLSGVPQQTISAIESGKRSNPGVETLFPLARTLNCLVDDLIGQDLSSRNFGRNSATPLAEQQE